MSSSRLKPSMPREMLFICQEELKRLSLHSLPRKIAFMRERGFADMDALHAWMHQTHHAFASMVQEQAQQRDERSERIAQHVAFLSELADDPVLAEDIFALHPEFKEKLRTFLLETPVIEHDDAPCTRVRHQG